LKLTQDPSTKRYVFWCAIHERFPAREAGFQFNNQLNPGQWSTDSARRALKLAAYAEEPLRARILEAAKGEVDPDRITLTYDGQTYKFFAPFQYKELAKQAGMVFAKHPHPCWWTTDPECAIRTFNNCAQYEGLFECAPELRAQLQNHLQERNASLDASRALDAEIDIPAPPGCEFLPFQKAGIAFAVKRQNTLIGDEMGLGKTLQAIGVCNATSPKRVLVICPASLKLNWKREFDKWDTNGLTVGIAESQFWPETDVVIINYDILGRASVGGKKVLRREIREVEWDLLIVDECHYVKSRKTARSKFTFAIQAKRKLALTGTPIPNKTIEIQPVASWLWPDVKAFEYWPFAKRFAGGRKGPFGFDVSGATHLPELQSLLRSTGMLRRLKSEVLKELPAKRRQVIELPAANLKRVIDAEQTAMEQHREMLAELRLRAELSKASDDPAEHAEAVKALREGNRVAFTEMSRYRHDTAMAKAPLVVEHVTDMLEEVPKILIFAHHIDLIKELSSVFKCAHIYGAIPPADRLAIVDDFNNNPEARVLVCQSDTAGVGFSVKASHIVVAELEWVPGTMSQCEDRAHGIGRGIEGEPLLIQHLVLEGSLDAQMARTLIAKQEIADRALDRQGGIDVELDDVDTEFPIEELVLPKQLACTDETVLQHRPATFDVKREQIAKEAEALSPEQIELVHQGLKILSGMCDGAVSRDGSGFNGMDSAIGKSLASQRSLTGRQAALGKRLLKKYAHTQLRGVVDSLFA
jgi:SWI/SNF-related matrix-associated actin-dependent regulator 1 of chromatin subfamily A